eukprot:CAMPEP_0196735548 /NCGR_PEP_ID=MMETSP1091-20130531/13954_1 /TAXON_ID=302021 /ORGANISM="Rhodomonas sp., Strain CCMP768" /LENGTH=44 /DNA_ID= /DNA_START= /DNA_END= /DNA_ORIENTATION=
MKICHKIEQHQCLSSNLFVVGDVARSTPLHVHTSPCQSPLGTAA